MKMDMQITTNTIIKYRVPGVAYWARAVTSRFWVRFPDL